MCEKEKEICEGGRELWKDRVKEGVRKAEMD